MKELSSDLHRLLDAERGPVPSAPAGTRERVLSRVQSTLGLSAASLVEPPPPAAPVLALGAQMPPPVAAALPGAARSAGAFLLGVAASAAVYLIARALQPAPVLPAAPVAVMVAAPIAGGASGAANGAALAAAAEAPPAAVGPALAVAAPALAPVPVVGSAALAPGKANRRSRARFATSAEPDSDLEAERALLDLARDALQRKDTTAALDVTRQHERRFPRGLLTEERELLVIRVLVGTHQRPVAEAHALAFRKRFPRSIFLPAVDALLQ